MLMITKSAFALISETILKLNQHLVPLFEIILGSLP
jgi:hypothetical protein